jgi:hypothetical protein
MTIEAKSKLEKAKQEKATFWLITITVPSLILLFALGPLTDHLGAGLFLLGISLFWIVFASVVIENSFAKPFCSVISIVEMYKKGYDHIIRNKLD